MEIKKEELKKWIKEHNNKICLIPNSRDIYPESERKSLGIQADVQELTDLGFNVTVISLKDYFDKVHHQIIGISQIATNKVPKIYTDAGYRESVCKANPSPDFVEEYLRLVTLGNDKEQMLEDIKEFYVKVKHGIELGQEYRIPIESSLKHLLLYLKNGALSYSSLPITSDMIALLDKKNGLTTKNMTDVMQLIESLKTKELELGG